MTLPQILVLTGIEYVSLVLLILATVGKYAKPNLMPLLIYAPIYIMTYALSHHFNYYVMLTIACISTVLFIKIVFNRTFSMSIFICLLMFTLSFGVIQTIGTLALGLFLSGPVEHTFGNGLIVMGFSLILSMLCYFYMPYVPLHAIPQALKDDCKRFVVMVIFFTMLAVFYIIIESQMFSLLREHTTLIEVFWFMGFSSILTVVCYSAIKYIQEQLAKRAAM